MTTRLRPLGVGLAAVALMLASAGAFGAHAAPVPDRSRESPPALGFDSLQVRMREAALELLRQECQEVKVFALQDTRGMVQIFATCIEWQEIRPASE